MKAIFLSILFCTGLVNSSIGQIKPPTKVTPITNPQKIKQIIPEPEPEMIYLEDITEPLCPQLLSRGDREFDGNGPKIKCDVTLSLKNNNTEIWARINFEAKETKQDWSTTSATWNIKVYTTAYGKKISKLAPDTDLFSRTAFVSPKAGAQFLVPGSDIKQGISTFFDGQVIASAVLHAHGLPFDASPAIAAKLVETYIKDNEIVRTPALEGRAVKFFHIVGDTGGEDISNDSNCKDDTRIEKIEFFPMKVFIVDVK